MNTTHLGTYGIVTKDGKILLVKKSRGPYTGKMDLPGGRLEHGETVKDALAREIREETGVEMKSATHFENVTTTVDFVDERGDVSMHHIGLLYVVTDFDNRKQVQEMDIEDSLGSDWFEFGSLDPNELSPFATIAVQHLQGS